jgi:PDZ domain-containing secreted protein
MGVIGVTYIEQRKNADELPAMGLIFNADSDGKAVIKGFLPEYKGNLLQVGDKIVRVLNKEFNNANYMTIIDSINAMKAGDTYLIDIIRGNSELQITETLYTKIDQHVLIASDKASERALKLRAILQKN